VLLPPGALRAVCESRAALIQVLVVAPSLFSGHCTVSVVGVVCTKEPVEYVPVTVIVYPSAGVTFLPPLLLLPPQATWKTKPANSMQASASAVSCPCLLFCSEPKPTRVATNAISGNQTA
jgi:hypothetical protein